MAIELVNTSSISVTAKTVTLETEATDSVNIQPRARITLREGDDVDYDWLLAHPEVLRNEG